MRNHNAQHRYLGYKRPVVSNGGSSPQVNAFKGDVIFNNVNVKDLTLDAHNVAWRGSCEKNPAYILLYSLI